MSSVQELVALGEKIGLEKDDLKEFIKEQQAVASTEREREREDKERDRQDKEKERQDKEKEWQDKEKERQDRERQQHIELEKERERTKQMELRMRYGEARMQATGDTDGEQLDVSASSVTAAPSKIRGPKIIAFDERDDMDSYLHRFERYADLQGWKKDVWAVYLSALLKGCLLYTSPSPRD